MKAMSDVMNTNDSIMARAEEKGGIVTKLANQVNLLVEKMAETVTVNNSVSVSTQNIAILIMKIPHSIRYPDNDTGMFSDITK